MPNSRRNRDKNFDMKSILHQLSHVVKKKIRNRYRQKSFEKTQGSRVAQNLMSRGVSSPTTPIYLALEGANGH